MVCYCSSVMQLILHTFQKFLAHIKPIISLKTFLTVSFTQFTELTLLLHVREVNYYTGIHIISSTFCFTMNKHPQKKGDYQVTYAHVANNIMYQTMLDTRNKYQNIVLSSSCHLEYRIIYLLRISHLITRTFAKEVHVTHKQLHVILLNHSTKSSPSLEMFKINVLNVTDGHIHTHVFKKSRLFSFLFFFLFFLTTWGLVSLNFNLLTKYLFGTL